MVFSWRMINGSSKLIKLRPKFTIDDFGGKMNDLKCLIIWVFEYVTCCECNLLCHSFPLLKRKKAFFSNSNYRSVKQWYAQSEGEQKVLVVGLEQDEVSISTQKPTPITQQTLVINHISSQRWRMNMKTLLFAFLDRLCLKASFIQFSI